LILAFVLALCFGIFVAVKRYSPETIDRLREKLPAGIVTNEEVDAATLWETARTHWNDGNTNKSVRYLQESAAKGFADAQVALGDLYVYGVGVPRDYAQGIAYYTQAAQQRNMRALMVLGDSYLNGLFGVGVDRAAAKRYYAQASALGDIRAKRELDAIERQDSAETFATNVIKTANPRDASGSQYKFRNPFPAREGVRGIRD